MERQAERFHEKFGRDPGPEDPIFFDPDAYEPRPFDLDIATREMAEELRHAGIAAEIDPSLIEAWCELGYVVTEDTRHLFSASDIAVWNEAVRRGYLGGVGPPTFSDRSGGLTATVRAHLVQVWRLAG
jgi:hypothetical protein